MTEIEPRSMEAQIRFSPSTKSNFCCALTSIFTGGEEFGFAAPSWLEQLVSQLGAAKPNSSPPVKILVRAQQKLLLVDGENLIWASIDRGSISVMARDVEGSSNYRTLEELGEALDSESFWKPNRSFLVNIHHIKEVVPWFNSTYMLKMNDKKHTEIPVSRSQIKRMRELFKL